VVVALTVATAVPVSVRSSPARKARDTPSLTTRPRPMYAPGRARSGNWTCNDAVRANWSGSRVATDARPRMRDH